MLKQALTYTPDTSLLFEKIAHEEWAIFLDSGKPAGEYGRYDIIVARPFITITTRNHRAYITQDETTTNFLEHDPFALLKRVMASYKNQCNNELNLPFSGGAVGYFAYDLARYLEVLADTAQDSADMPEMSVGIYDWAVVVDHRDKCAWLVSQGYDSRTKEIWPDLCRLFESPTQQNTRHLSMSNALPSHAFRVGGSELDSSKPDKVVHSNMDLAAYSAAFNRIKRYILEGDCYQVNLAQRFSVKAEGDAWIAYKKLREISPAPFMAYINLPQCQVLSGSPERFLQVINQHVETRPIKGTRPRAADAAQDAANAKALVDSLKDQAENLMIVDLLRNDISKSCEIGSVKVPNLFSLQSFAYVHHLVSTVTGVLRADKTPVDLLGGCFPGGSITGAPKLRAMQIIEELEPHRRGLYCGSIGYIGFDGNMDTNIAIRSIVYANNEMSFYAGGGIVADSEMLKEYTETWDKAASMLKLMQYFGAEIDYPNLVSNPSTPKPTAQ